MNLVWFFVLSPFLFLFCFMLWILLPFLWLFYLYQHCFCTPFCPHNCHVCTFKLMLSLVLFVVLFPFTNSTVFGGAISYIRVYFLCNRAWRWRIICSSWGGKVVSWALWWNEAFCSMNLIHRWHAVHVRHMWTRGISSAYIQQTSMQTSTNQGSCM